ncbi:putative eukaryotic translation initiation factor 4 gamma [Golovinomyces cichoracearum]|uniref:Putative eukaryotic translation initiation factor 4 gamma n=1 Tax=Golovinomyces cichoracearum TaxID=62708 RepID=A0A420IZY4_9PEZI|nr:putative eukaryotic translation initiation factor 4 gamma [Golovinomyces cichoracearum]
MTSISQQSQTPSKTSSASILTSSYSSAAKKAVSSPPVAAGSSSQSPIVAIGSFGPVQPNHGKSSSIMPINGKHSISPAVPVVSAPSIAYSSSVINGTQNHNRKSSITISANSRNSINGGPVSGSSGKIQFGSITDSPITSQSTPQIYQQTASTPISIVNPRVSDPSHSPSPIPQPSASGGRPPVVGPSNCVNFGSFGGESDRHIRQAAGHPPPSAPCAPQNCHSRHDSSQSIQSDMSNPQGRGGFPHQSSRGRGGFQNQYSQQQMGGYPQPSNSFRNAQGQGRGGISPFQGQGRPPFPNSPLQSSRSPAIPNSSMAGTPNMNPSIPMPNQQQYSAPYFHQHLASQQFNYSPQYDARGMLVQGTAYLYPQIQNMGYIPGIPQSPQTGFQQPHYTPGQYAPQAQQMSRTSSQISDQQAGPNMAQPRTPSITSIAHPLTPQSKTSSKIPASFTRPTRKSAAIVIKRPDGEAVDIESFKAPASPAPSARAGTPPIIASNPTFTSKPTSTEKANEESPGIKTSDQIKKEIIEKVQKSANADNKTSLCQSSQTEQTNSDSNEKDVKEEINVVQEEKPDDQKKAVADSTIQPSLEDDDIERHIAEIEAAEAERDRVEAEKVRKRDAERAIAKAEQERLREIAEKEESQKLREQELEMERLEDEREKKRAEIESNRAGASLAKSVKDLLKETSANLEIHSSKSEAAQAPKIMIPKVEASTSTSTHDEPMGPPPKVIQAEKRVNKPSALNLTPLSGKPVEPPQPSAALRSLKSARFLTVLDPMIYPPSIHSPNPALNQAVKNKGKSFKYDKEFLLQFQKVFVEKPSMEFESQIKALIGESDIGATRSGSTRAADNMATRSNSSRNSTQGAFNMGSFASTNSGKSLAPATASDQRYSVSGGSISRPQISSMTPFIRSRSTAFPAGNTMARNPSNSGMPHSPRQQSRRGNASNKGYNNSNSKQDSQAAKSMPLTAGAEVKPIQISATGWKPRSIGNSQSGPVPGSSHMDPDMVQRKVKAALNKMTPEKFDKIADQILSIAAQSKDEADGRTLRQVIQLTFEKATDEAHWASMYAKFCKRMLETMSPEIKDETILDKNGEVVFGGNLFRKYLLNRCQEEFERGWKIDLPEKPKGERGEEKTEEAVMLSDEYYLAAAAKRRGLGLVQFIGELYKLSMLTERIMHQCVKKLVDHTGIPDEAEIESLTKLLKTIGANLDSNEKGKLVMDAYFSRINIMISTPELPSRLKFMLMDIVDLRKKGWASKESNKGPKTLEEAEEAAVQKAAENARSNQRGGGGGRISMGRGDSRSFSNQYSNQPPTDLHKNIVATDDLRRLTNNKNNPRASSHQMTFGPTSMFNSRSSSGRKMGPGGSFNRLADEPGSLSRSSTLPHQKEKESTTSANSYSLLAGLGSSEVENPASPPSTSASPVSTKATPSFAEKSE